MYLSLKPVRKTGFQRADVKYLAIWESVSNGITNNQQHQLKLNYLVLAALCVADQGEPYFVSTEQRYFELYM